MALDGQARGEIRFPAVPGERAVPSTSRRVRRAIAVSLLACIVLAACGGDDDDGGASGSTTAEPSTTTATGATTTGTGAPMFATTIYFLDEDAHLASAGRQVASARAAIDALLAGPQGIEKEIGYSSAIPAGTRLLGLTVADGVATVDLSGEFDDGGGSASMLGRVAQVVYTLTVFGDIQQVKFALDGQPVDTIGGEGVVVGPEGVDRSAFDAVLPAILVELPPPGTRVTSPLLLRGISNTYEATVNYELTDPEGDVTAEGNVMGGTLDQWAPFSGSIEYETERTGLGELIVFEVSAEDGSRVNLVEIPVMLE